MDTAGEGLPDGARVAVVGGGIAAVAVAAALGIAGRVRGRTFHVHVHDPQRPRPTRPPVLLTAACRAQLSALGCKIPSSWGISPIPGVTAHQAGRSARLPPPPAPLAWLPDAAPLRQALAASASMHGAIFLGRRVEVITQIPERGAGPSSPSRGEWVVRAQGRADRYHAVILAGGLGRSGAHGAWRQYRPPPSVRAISLRLSGSRPHAEAHAHVMLLPAPGLTALELFPEPGGWYAVAWGPGATPATLGEALARAAAAGLFPAGLEPGLPTVGLHPAGVARGLATRGLLAVGNAALGHPLEHGLEALLAGCSSAAHALVRHGPDSSAMVHTHAVEGLRAAEARTHDAVRATTALHDAGPRALESLVAASLAPLPWLSSEPGCFGLTQPTATEAARTARAAARRRRFRGLLSAHVPAVPFPRAHQEAAHVVIVEPDAGRAHRLVYALTKRGAQCHVRGEGLWLLRDVERLQPSAVVLGEYLPWVDARSLCLAIKGRPETAAIPLVTLGDGARPHHRRMLESAGAHWVDAAVPFEEALAAYLVPIPVETPPALSGISASYGGAT